MHELHFFFFFIRSQFIAVQVRHQFFYRMTIYKQPKYVTHILHISLTFTNKVHSLHTFINFACVRVGTCLTIFFFFVIDGFDLKLMIFVFIIIFSAFLLKI